MKLSRQSTGCQRNRTISRMTCCVYLVQSLNRARLLFDMGITPSDQRIHPADSPQTFLSWFWKAAAIGCAALCVFAFDLSAKFFEDEDAYITQSYYADLFLAGRVHDRAWLEFPAYDLQPLPKYLIGLSLRLAHLPVPAPRDAIDWYRSYKPFGTYPTRIVARLPFIGLGALGVVAIFACGTLLKDWRVGAVAALLLTLNPLYRLHAHRAMSDTPCEAFMLAGLALFLWTWRRTWTGKIDLADFLVSCLAGLCFGLSILCKFNGFLGFVIIGAWSGLAMITPGLDVRRKLVIAGQSIVAFIVALAVLVGLNPFMTAHPRGLVSSDQPELALMNVWDRFHFQVKHRLELSDNQKRQFPDDALYAFADKAKVVAVQGLGRFGPFGPSDSDSTVRFDLRQDWGAILWVPAVLLGLFLSIRIGRYQYQSGQAPTAVALFFWAALGWVVVTLYLPMAWNRYLLPIQSGNVLLAALAAGAAWDKLVGRDSIVGTRT
jgi:4-amino-4-deoxy-L-arabinose transferase-like glycosyltransferase